MPFWSSKKDEEVAPLPPSFEPPSSSQRSAALIMATNEVKGMTELFARYVK
jgi:hypothetical protein